jgi:hypothetical protein
MIEIRHINDKDFLDVFREDLANSFHNIIILSPFVSPNRAIHYYPPLQAAHLRGVQIDIYIRPKYEQPEILLNGFDQVIVALKRIPVGLHERKGAHEKIAAIDGRILWHGSLNILSHYESRESMLRIVSPELTNDILNNLGLCHYQNGGNENHLKAAEASKKLNFLESPLCPICSDQMHYFNDAGLWICQKSPFCPGTRSYTQENGFVSENPLEMQKISLLCPLCQSPMVISRAVFLRIKCSSIDCSFALDPRLSKGLLRVLNKQEAI